MKFFVVLLAVCLVSSAQELSAKVGEKGLGGMMEGTFGVETNDKVTAANAESQPALSPSVSGSLDSKLGGSVSLDSSISTLPQTLADSKLDKSWLLNLLTNGGTTGSPNVSKLLILLNGMREKGTAMSSKVLEALLTTGGRVTDTGSTEVNNLVNRLDVSEFLNILKTMREKGTEMPSKVLEALITTGGRVTDTGSTMVNNLVNRLDLPQLLNLLNKIREKGTEMPSKVLEALLNTGGRVASVTSSTAVNNLDVSHVMALLNQVGGKGTGLPSKVLEALLTTGGRVANAVTGSTSGINLGTSLPNSQLQNVLSALYKTGTDLPVKVIQSLMSSGGQLNLGLLNGGGGGGAEVSSTGVSGGTQVSGGGVLSLNRWPLTTFFRSLLLQAARTGGELVKVPVNAQANRLSSALDMTDKAVKLGTNLLKGVVTVGTDTGKTFVGRLANTASNAVDGGTKLLQTFLG